MEPEGSLPQSQVHAACPYPKPARSSPHPHTHFLKIHLNIIPHLHLGLPNGLFPPGFPTITLYTSLLTPIRSTCPTHLILLDFITLTILGEEYRSFSSSLSSDENYSAMFKSNRVILLFEFTVFGKKVEYKTHNEIYKIYTLNWHIRIPW